MRSFRIERLMGRQSSELFLMCGIVEELVGRRLLNFEDFSASKLPAVYLFENIGRP